MSKIYHVVLKIGPPSNCLATVTEESDSCLDDVMNDVTHAHDVISRE